MIELFHLLIHIHFHARIPDSKFMTIIKLKNTWPPGDLTSSLR